MSFKLDKSKQLISGFQATDEYQEKLLQKLKIVDSCERSAESRSITFEICKEDAVFFIENFLWTYDPRPGHDPHHFPFILFDFQRDAVHWIINKIKNGEDGLMEKSRDMGATWLFMSVLLWFWRFDPSFSATIGSYKEKLVDDRTLDSLYGKIDYQLNSLPKWLIPARFKFKDHRQSMKLVNPENQNLIMGDSMNPDFSRGSRKNVVFLDEGASWEYFREAWESAGDSTPCRITCSTPKGRNAFAIQRESGIDVLTLHWSKHPFKDKEWYDFECERRTDEEIAQELDISYNKSQEGRVYPEWDDVQHGSYPYDPQYPLYVSWDFGFTDDTALIWWQTVPNSNIRIIDCYSNHGKIIDFFVPFITGITPSDTRLYSKRDFKIIESHKGWKPAIHFGDPAGRFTNQVTNQSVMDVLKQYGIHVNFSEEAKDFQTRKTAAKILMRTLVVNINDNTNEMDAAMQNASYPKIRKGGSEQIRSLKPSHDWSSHYRSSFEYFAVNNNRFSARRKIYDKFAKKEKAPRAISY